MSSVLVGHDEVPGATRPARPARRRPRWLLVAAACGLAWVVPSATHAVGADAVLPVLLWAGTAALLRSGRTLLDRLMPAAALWCGLVGAGGLLFSVWPWGLHPVPVAATAFTGLVAVSALTGRRPHLPRRVGQLSDVFLVGAVAAVAVLITHPLRGGLTNQLATVVRGEDAARHFALYDGIRQFGGYLALHRDSTATLLQPGFDTYPQGSHLAIALLDNFVRSDTAAGPADTALGHFLWWYAASFVFMTLSALWALRWVAGPSARGWAYLPLAALAAGYLFLADGVTLFVYGFASEIAGLALLALLVAFLARPLRDGREQIVVVTALVVALSMTYYLFLLTTAVVVAGWAFAQRRRLVAAWRWSAPAVLVGGALTLFAPLTNWHRANRVSQLTSYGNIEPLNRHLLALLLVVVCAGLATAAARRHPVWRMVALWLAVTAAYTAGLYAYSVHRTGEPTYYVEKALHQLLLVALVAAGALTLLLRRPLRPPAAVDRILAAGSTALAVLLGLAFFSGPYTAGFAQPPAGVSWGRAYVRGQLGLPEPAAVAVAAYRQRPTPGGAANVILMTGAGGDQSSYYGTLWLSVLERNYGQAWQAWIWTLGGPKRPDDIRELVRTSRVPLRFVTDSAMVADTVAEIGREDPAARVEVVVVDPRGLPG